MAVRSKNDGQSHFVTLSSGTVLDVTGEVQRSGLVDIIHDGCVLAAFLRDVQDRADPIEARLCA